MNIEPEQPRLVAGPMQLVLRNKARTEARTHDLWALPGGGYCTTHEVERLCEANGWRPPTRVMVGVVHRSVR